MDSFICTELVALFHKRNKYTDFDWVVRCVIRRKVLHYVGTHVRKNKKLVFPSNTKLKTDDRENRHSSEEALIDEKTYEYIKHKTVNDEMKNRLLKETVDNIKDMYQKIKIQPLSTFFTDWDREYMEVVLELYDLDSELDKKDIMECMGYDKDEVAQFNSKLLSLRTKLHSYFNVEEI